MLTLLFDFDGTAFDTFTPLDGGVGVEENYELSIKELFGSEVLDQHLETGGLRGRDPGSVVRELFPRFSEDKLSELTSRLIDVRLNRVLSQIGRASGDALWPPPCAGFIDFWWRVGATPGIRTGLISSGHTVFIEQVWRLYRLRMPDIVISFDDIHKVEYPPAAERAKPYTFQMQLALEGLARQNQEDPVQAWASRPDVIYFGDDLSRDRELARRAGVKFGHFDPNCQAAMTEDGWCFSDWEQPLNWLDQWILSGFSATVVIGR